MSACPGKDIDDALYQIGIIADIMASVASADMSGSKHLCGTSVDWLSEQLEIQHNRIGVAIRQMQPKS